MMRRSEQIKQKIKELLEEIEQLERQYRHESAAKVTAQVVALEWVLKRREFL